MKNSWRASIYDESMFFLNNGEASEIQYLTKKFWRMFDDIPAALDPWFIMKESNEGSKLHDLKKNCSKPDEASWFVYLS